ncbi:ABC transporter permease [Micromonospora zingiberis]|uniref:ABC transporter permease n=1 Tax=Micromonospora zingiberis TaxID=2053011 RepID=A0A4R0GH21_9ACTN|nr:ABC transporter permease [Micromonospora zingiberis]TCB96714.1 ABC transporter permease [Micromonospora zingiberis]
MTVTGTSELHRLRTVAAVAPRRRMFGLRNLLRAMVPIAAVLLWHQVTTSGSVSTQFFPPPLAVGEALVDLVRSGELTTALGTSLSRAGIGLAFGVLIGIAFGIVNGLFRLGEEIFDSSLQIVRQVPFIAMVPLFIIWFGIGEELKVIIITLACVFPVYLNTYMGVRYVDPNIIEAGRVFGLSRPGIIFRIIVPASLPSVLVGIRYSMGTALLALIIAEQVNANSGIGQTISVAASALRIDIVTAGIVVYALLGIAVDVVMRLLERILLPWARKATP